MRGGFEVVDRAGHVDGGGGGGGRREWNRVGRGLEGSRKQREGRGGGGMPPLWSPASGNHGNGDEQGRGGRRTAIAAGRVR